MRFSTYCDSLGKSIESAFQKKNQFSWNPWINQKYKSKISQKILLELRVYFYRWKASIGLDFNAFSIFQFLGGRLLVGRLFMLHVMIDVHWNDISCTTSFVRWWNWYSFIEWIIFIFNRDNGEYIWLGCKCLKDDKGIALLNL